MEVRTTISIKSSLEMLGVHPLKLRVKMLPIELNMYERGVLDFVRIRNEPGLGRFVRYVTDGGISEKMTSRFFQCFFQQPIMILMSALFPPTM
jgi:hypothetical protein